VTSSNPFDALAGGRYVRLSTFRKSGAAVPTPPWFARMGENLYVVTGRNTGKVKRIRNNPDVTLAPSDFRGRPEGPHLRAVAGLTEEKRGGPADRALRRKYGWQYRVVEVIEGLLAVVNERVYLELRPPDEREE
jgi:PPOX class probable F420-dependent enzyme